MSQSMNPKKWPNTQAEYAPDLEHGSEIRSALREFANSTLSKTTSVRVFSVLPDILDINEQICEEKQLVKYLGGKHQFCQQIFFINRFLIDKKKNEKPPDDAKKLRVSLSAWLQLVSSLQVPPAFTFALSRYFLPPAKGQKKFANAAGEILHEFWYFLPLRMQVHCTDSQLNHTKSTGGNSQINPFHYLHLPDHDADIRGAQIAIYFQYNANTQRTRTVVVNMTDGRWPMVVEEPQMRIKEALEHNGIFSSRNNPFMLHIVYFTSALRWWTNALETINSQLISWEGKLQQAPQTEETSEFHETLNVALHAIAAHLHRYELELGSMEETVKGLISHHKAVLGPARNSQRDPSQISSFDRVDDGLCQVLLQLNPIQHFESELDKKVQNILALLFNRIQLSNDRLMLSTSTAMSAILLATQAETHASQEMVAHAQELTEEMKKDSLSMKTIAILGMAFLPGASWAAFLAMPFFTENPYLTNTGRVWVWVALTLPTTGAAFIFYWFSIQRSAKRARKNRKMVHNGTAVPMNRLNGSATLTAG